MLFDIKNKNIQSYINKIAGLSRQGDSEIKIGSTVQPTLEVGPQLICKQLTKATSGGDAVWINDSIDKSIYLKGGLITVTKDAACAGAQFIELLGQYPSLETGVATTGILFYISAAALVATGNVQVYEFELPGMGLRINGNLMVSVNGAFTAGGSSTTVWGYLI